MAAEWYYSQNGNQYGPLSGSELKQLSASGKLLPGDLVWKDGMDDWKPAAQVKGLLPERPPIRQATVAPASRPARATASHHRSANNKAWLSGLTTNTKAAGQLIARQAERTKLAQVALPAAYRELGQHIHANNRFRNELSNEFAPIDNLQRKLKDLESPAEPSDTSPAASDKVKALADSAKSAAIRKVLEQKRAQAYGALGKAALERHGQQVGPEQLVEKLSELRTRLETLDAEISELCQSSQEQVFTPKRIAIGGVAVTALFLLFILKALLPEGNPDRSIVTNRERIVGAFNSEPSSNDDVFESGRSSIDDAFNRGRSNADDAFNRGRSRVDDAFNRGRSSVDDAFNRGRSRVGDAYERGARRIGGEKKSSTTKSSAMNGAASDSQWEQLATILVRDVKPGMSAEWVRSLMGTPHEVNEHDIAGKHIVIWTWKKESDPENSFIHLDVTGGSVQAGGSTGYDIRTGFKTKLPSYNVGGPAERAKLKRALENLGVEVEE